LSPPEELEDSCWGMEGKYTGRGAVEGSIRGTSLFDVSVVGPLSNI